MSTPGGLVDKQELIDAQLDTAHLGRVVNSKDASGAPINKSTNRTGGENKTLNALEAEYQGEIDSLEARSDAAIADAETAFDTQRDQFNATFQSQFAYKRIGNISDYVGQSLPEADKLNSYQYPDDSGEWYGPVQSQSFPILIPADPSASSEWALVNALTSDSLSLYTDIVYKASGVKSAVQNMVEKAGIGEICKCENGSEFKRTASTDSIADFTPLNRSNILDFGAGTSIDNSTQISLALSVNKKIKVTGGNYDFSSLDLPAGSDILQDEDSSIAVSSANGLTFDSARYVEIDVTTTGGKGSKTFTVSDASSLSVGDAIFVLFRDDVTDPYYISIAENPNEYGWQAQRMTVSLINGNSITTLEPLLFNFKAGYTNSVRKIVTEKTRITGGRLINKSSSSICNGPCDNLVLSDLEIDCNNSLGMRLIRCFGVSVIKGSKVYNVNGNGGLLFGYGVISSGVVDSEFGNGTGGDAMLIWFAGSNNCISQRNKFFGNDMVGSQYFGAKTWNMQSVDDEFYGGKYGLFTNFGSRDLQIVRPRLIGQSLAGVFLEKTQYSTVDTPRVKSDLLVNDVQTQGGVILKDCDHSVKVINPEIETSGGRTISVFNSPGSEVVRNNLHFIGGDLKGGKFRLQNPVMNLKILNVTSEFDITSYFTYSSSQEGEIVGNKVSNGRLSLRSMRNSNIHDNEVDASGGDFGVELTGSTRFCILRRNRVSNADVAYSVPSDVTSRYATAIYPDNIMINCNSYIDNGVGFSASFKPSLGIEAPRNFFIPVTVSDFSSAQTVAGYRAKGNGATDSNAWVRVLVSEDLV